MIPNSPNWSTYKGLSPSPTTELVSPEPISATVQDVVLGPFGIGDSRGRLNARYWTVSQSNGKVIVQYSQG